LYYRYTVQSQVSFCSKIKLDDNIQRETLSQNGKGFVGKKIFVSINIYSTWKLPVDLEVIMTRVPGNGTPFNGLSPEVNKEYRYDRIKPGMETKEIRKYKNYPVHINFGSFNFLFFLSSSFII
jgi:hypothetical protein